MASDENPFPNLVPDNVTETHPENKDYNCIAWAAGNDTNIWWPHDSGPSTYWPPNVPRELTVDAFIAVFALRGYQICEHGELEPGVEKIAIYTDSDGEPRHAARQLPDGQWTSKMGRIGVWTHKTLRDFEGPRYGFVKVIMSRPASAGSPQPSADTSPVE